MVKCLLILSLQVAYILTFNYTIYLISNPKIALVKACEDMANIPQNSREHWQNMLFTSPYLKACS